jgi:hypothetical protein
MSLIVLPNLRLIHVQDKIHALSESKTFPRSLSSLLPLSSTKPFSAMSILGTLAGQPTFQCPQYPMPRYVQLYRLIGMATVSSCFAAGMPSFVVLCPTDGETPASKRRAASLLNVFRNSVACASQENQNLKSSHRPTILGI